LLPCPAQTVVVYAATKGYMDRVDVRDITKAEQVVLQHMDPKVYKVLNAERKISPQLNQHLHNIIKAMPMPVKTA
jgi:F-type H+-transporting ATPase subunit alpha